MELVQKYRPKKLDKVIGQQKAVNHLKALISKKDKMPQVYMLMGPSGTGKTSLARAMCNELGATHVTEINTADFGGIEFARELRSNIAKFPMSGTFRAYICDEAHGMSRDAQQCLLKVMEEIPPKALMFFATTEPAKMIEPLMQRCTKIKLELVGDDDLGKLIARIQKKEGIELSKKVLRQIIETSAGSPRNAIKFLDQVSRHKNEESQLECLVSADVKSTAIDICRALIAHRPWSEICKLVESVKDEAETVRNCIMGYITSILLKGSGPIDRALQIGQMCESPWYINGKAVMTVTLCTLSGKKK